MSEPNQTNLNKFLNLQKQFNDLCVLLIKYLELPNQKTVTTLKTFLQKLDPESNVFNYHNHQKQHRGPLYNYSNNYADSLIQLKQVLINKDNLSLSLDLDAISPHLINHLINKYNVLSDNMFQRYWQLGGQPKVKDPKTGEIKLDEKHEIKHDLVSSSLKNQIANNEIKLADLLSVASANTSNHNQTRSENQSINSETKPQKVSLINKITNWFKNIFHR